jgi:uncharacterized delta-60 repeat protein
VTRLVGTSSAGFAAPGYNRIDIKISVTAHQCICTFPAEISHVLAMKRMSPKIPLLLVPAIILLIGKPAPVIAQSALDGFDPNSNGTIGSLVVQPDGKILIAGSFTTLSPNGGAAITRNRIARLNADGTIDSAFDPNANATVSAIVLQPDGKILLGGPFTTIGGQTRNRIARVNSDGTLDPSFDPNASGPSTPQINALALQADGKILAGGLFTNIGGQPRTNIARLDPITGLADSFNPNANDQVLTFAVQADGKILAGGRFLSIGGQTRNRIARLDPNTGLVDAFNPNANSVITTIALQTDGKILTGGFFQQGFGTPTIGGQTRNRVARLDPVTGAADSFNPNANNFVRVIAVQADGKILVGGDFTGANSIGGAPRNNIARLDAVTGLADSFDPSANSLTVFAVAQQSDGKILLGGIFTALAPSGGTSVTRNRIARLETDGRVDRTLDLNLAGGFVTATALQPDGRILVGGSFTSVSGITQNNIARLNTAGALDLQFDPFPNDFIHTIAVQADGKILVGGFFTHIGAGGGQDRNRIARLGPETGLADSFNPNADREVFSIAVQTDGKILAGGRFTTIGGQTRLSIARLDPATGLADSFNPIANERIFCIAVQPDGKILVGGSFTHIGGQTRNRIARLDPATGLPDSFNPNADDNVYALAVQPDGKILVGGVFTTIGGQTRNNIARLYPSTGTADSFDPNVNPAAGNAVFSIAVQSDGKVLAGGGFSTIGGQTRHFIARLDAMSGLPDSFDPNASHTVYSVALQADGKILAGGDFTTMGGQPRNLFARLSNDTAALQNLAVSRRSITWTRGGSSSLFARVAFEFSADNVSYNSLGNATADGSNWTLTGLNLPVGQGQSFYIRARGYCRSGYNNGSESTQEWVRSIVLTLPPAPSQVVSRKIHGAAGIFDINLPLSGDPGIECRSGGTNNDCQIVFSFPNSVTFTNASVTTGDGSVSGTNGSGTSTITANLTNVTNAQKLTVTLFGASDGTNTGDLSVQMGVLLGDTNGNGAVNATDVSQAKLGSGQAVDATNFRSDATVNGTINASDVSLVKLRSGTALP